MLYKHLVVRCGVAVVIGTGIGAVVDFFTPGDFLYDTLVVVISIAAVYTAFEVLDFLAERNK